jgi:hypothetical protein
MLSWMKAPRAGSERTPKRRVFLRKCTRRNCSRARCRRPRTRTGQGNRQPKHWPTTSGQSIGDGVLLAQRTASVATVNALSNLAAIRNRNIHPPNPHFSAFSRGRHSHCDGHKNMYGLAPRRTRTLFVESFHKSFSFENELYIMERRADVPLRKENLP